MWINRENRNTNSAANIHYALREVDAGLEDEFRRARRQMQYMQEINK